MIKPIKESLKIENGDERQALEKRLAVELEERFELGGTCVQDYCGGYHGPVGL